MNICGAGFLIFSDSLKSLRSDSLPSLRGDGGGRTSSPDVAGGGDDGVGGFFIVGVNEAILSFSVVEANSFSLKKMSLTLTVGKQNVMSKRGKTTKQMGPTLIIGSLRVFYVVIV